MSSETLVFKSRTDTVYTHVIPKAGVDYWTRQAKDMDKPVRVRGCYVPDEKVNEVFNLKRKGILTLNDLGLLFDEAKRKDFRGDGGKVIWSDGENYRPSALIDQVERRTGKIEPPPVRRK